LPSKINFLSFFQMFMVQEKSGNKDA